MYPNYRTTYDVFTTILEDSDWQATEEEVLTETAQQLMCSVEHVLRAITICHAFDD